MKGLQWSLLQGIILTVIIVLIGTLLIGPVKGFDVTKYFGIQSILGQPGEGNVGSLIFTPVLEVKTRCGIFEGNGAGWLWSKTPSPVGSPIFSETQLLTIDKFQSEACPSGTLPVACATYPELNSLDDTTGKKYGEDAIVSIYNDTDNTCVVYAQEGYDTNQARYVGVLCANLDPADVQYKWIDFPTTNPIDPTRDNDFVSNSCPAGFSPISGMVKADPIITSDDARPRIFGLNTTAAMLKNSESKTKFPNRQFGLVCVKNSAFTNCAIHNYNFVNPVDYRHWSKIATTWTDNIYENFKEEPCPGDSSLISCGYNIISQDDSRINALFPSNLSDDKNFGTSGFLINTCNIQDSISHGWTVASNWFGNDKTGIEAICAENLWYWSDWQEKTSSGSGYFSVSCPSGTDAIACASDTASLESGFTDMSGRDYAHDLIGVINFTVDSSTSKRNGCFIGSQSTGKYKRRVGALCIQDAYYSDFIYKITSFNDPSKATSGTCGSGFSPIFCTLQADPAKIWINGEDIDLNAGTCSFDIGSNSASHNGFIGVLCADYSKVKVPEWKSQFFMHSDVKYTPFFASQSSCDSGSIATTALTIRDSSDISDLFSMVPTSDLRNFVIGVYASGGDASRKVGVACLNYPKEDFMPIPPTVTTCFGVNGVGGNCDQTSDCTGSGWHCTNNYFDCPFGARCCCVPLTTPATCGDNICSGETSTNCCKDCGCSSGTCQSNVCCGASGQPCCTTGSQCTSGLACISGTCQASTQFTYSLSLSPSSDTVTQGVAFSKTVTITVTSTNPLSTPQPVSLSYSVVAPIPGSVIGTLPSPSICTPSATSPYQCTSIFTISGTATSTGDYPIAISGTSAGSPSSPATVIYTLTVNPASSSCTSCGSWTNGACGTGGCAATQRQQTRTGTPAGCSLCPDGFGLSQCVADASCGSVPSCGILGLPCCAGAVCSDGSTCNIASWTCGTSAPCGGLDQPCCAGNTCNSPLTCDTYWNVCQQPSTCGGSGQPCCAGNTCNSPLTCTSGTCTGGGSPNCGSSTGGYCAASNGGCQAGGGFCGTPSYDCGVCCCVGSYSLSINPSSGTTYDNQPGFSQTFSITATATSGITPQTINFAVSGSVPGTTTTSPNPCTTSASPPYKCTSSFVMSGNPSTPGTYTITVTGTSANGGIQSTNSIITVVSVPHCAGTPNPCNQFTWMGTGSCNYLQPGCYDPIAGPCLGSPSQCFGRGPGILCGGLYGDSGCTWYAS